MKDNNRFSKLQSLQRPVNSKKDVPLINDNQHPVVESVDSVPSLVPVSVIDRSRRGKSSNPEFTKITAYIKKATHKKASLILMEQEKEDFSELLERLVSDWINKQS
jgi:hypothetical protein